MSSRIAWARIGCCAFALLVAACSGSKGGGGGAGGGGSGGGAGGSAGIGGGGSGGTGGTAGSGSGGSGGEGAGGASGSQVVGTSGGTVSAVGVTLDVPASALGADTAITVATTTTPAGYTAASAAYQFGPAGTTFAQPVAVTIPLSAPAPGAHLFWSNASGGFDDLGGTVNGLSVTANVSHFSIGFCAVPASDGGASDAPIDAASGGSGGQGGAADAGGAAGAGGGGGTDGGAADAGTLTGDAAAALCTTVALNLPGATVTNVDAGSPPDSSTYTGGTLVSGKHYLTAVAHYGGGTFTGSTRAVYTIDAAAGTIQIGEFAGNGSSFIGMTYTNVDAHTLQIDVVCHTGSGVLPGPQVYYTVSGSALTMTTVGSSDVLTIGPP